MVYIKRCCKCVEGIKVLKEPIGECDLILCDKCYIDVLIESYIKCQCSQNSKH
jgi:hypothetical protein